jgi:hypothetical protein
MTIRSYSRFHWRWNSATFSNLIYQFKMDFRSSNFKRAPASYFHYYTSQVTWSYSHTSSDIYWEITILHIVLIIQFNFENNTQIPPVKLCIHVFGAPCVLLFMRKGHSFERWLYWSSWEKKIHMDIFLILNDYRATAVWTSGINSIRFLFLVLDVERRFKKTSEYTRQIGRSHFGCYCPWRSTVTDSTRSYLHELQGTVSWTVVFSNIYCEL